jgi:hypothetical protein
MRYFLEGFAFGLILIVLACSNHRQKPSGVQLPPHQVERSHFKDPDAFYVHATDTLTGVMYLHQYPQFGNDRVITQVVK